MTTISEWFRNSNSTIVICRYLVEVSSQKLLIAGFGVPVKPHSFYLDVHINGPLLEEAAAEQDDVKELLPDWQQIGRAHV